MQLIYITFPYPYNLNAAPQVFERAAMVMKWMKEMSRNDYVCVCPHIEYHMLGLTEYSWEDRKESVLRLLESVEAVQVLMFPGWEESACVKDEVLRARSQGKPVHYVNTEELQAWYADLERTRSDFVSGLEVQVRALADADSVGFHGDGELRDAESVDSG